MAWHNDPFTEILFHQVETQFSMDGVIPPLRTGTHRAEKAYGGARVVLPKREFQKLSHAVDGIRLLPWKPAPKRA